MKSVAAGAERSGVIAAVAVNHVVAGPAEQRVGPFSAADRVVVAFAVERHRDQRGELAAGRERVVPIAALDR